MKMKKKVLWISLMAPYDTVGHAGGKIENFYLKYLHANSSADVTLVSLCKDFEVPKLDLDKYGIKSKITVRKWKGLQGIIHRGIAWLSKFNVFNQYGGLTPCDISKGISKMLDELVFEKYSPDCIVLEWTEILFMLPKIKKCFPNVPVVSIEEDVSYLGQYRRWNYSKNWLTKQFYAIKYKRVKQLELKYLNEVEYVVLNNHKDYNLIKKDGLKNSNVWVWAPYFQSYIEKKPKRQEKNIVFYGAMAREENWKSAEWFILNVMPLLKDQEIKFVIVGSNPVKKLCQYSSDRVIVRGFVDDISVELSSAMCLVAPLVLGAGIKIKVLEAFSCGIPVLTNSIGIEGIPAVDKESFYYCEKPEEYANVIMQLANNKIDVDEIELNAKNVIINNFNFNEDAKKFVKIIEDLCEE